MRMRQDREQLLSTANHELRSLQVQARANAAKLADCQTAANVIECQMDELSARSSHGQSNNGTIGEMMRALKDARAAQMQIETTLITDLIAARGRVSELTAIVAATQADADAEEDLAVAQWEAETAAAVQEMAPQGQLLESERANASGAAGAAVQTRAAGAVDHIVVIDYTGCNGIIQVGLATEPKPRLTYTPDDYVVSAAFELHSLSSLQKEACCGYELAACFPSQQHSLLRRADGKGPRCTTDQRAQAMTELLDAALSTLLGTDKAIDQVLMTAEDHKSVGPLCYRIARLYSTDAVKSASQLQLYSRLLAALDTKYGFRMTRNEQLTDVLERVLFHLSWHGVEVASIDGFDELVAGDFRSAYLELCSTMFKDLGVDAARCKVLFTTVLDRPDACESDESADGADDGWTTMGAGGKVRSGLVASEMCQSVAADDCWVEELQKLNQPDPGVIHFSDWAARCMSSVLVEDLGVAAVQCIPPVQDPWAAGWSSIEASWAGAAAVARELPDQTSAIEVQGANRSSKLVLNGEPISWIFADDGERQGIPKSERRQPTEGVWSHLVYAKFGSVLVAAFQPQGRLTDVFEET